MQVKELIEALMKVDPSAYVVVGCDIIHGIEVVQGKIEIGYYNPQFIYGHYGQVKAIRFLANTELSTGEVVSFYR